MKTLLIAAGMATALLTSVASYAQTTTAWRTAASAYTGLCNDGFVTSIKTKRNACSGHNGLKRWYSDSAASANATGKAAPATTKAAKPAANTMTMTFNAPIHPKDTPRPAATPGNPHPRAPGEPTSVRWDIQNAIK